MAYTGKSAIITGGASGIGLGIATHLVKEGANVVLADRNAVGGAAAVLQLNEGRSSPVAAFIETDITSWPSQCRLFTFARTTFGNIDYVFANAGISQMRAMNSSDPTHFATAAISKLEDLENSPPDLAVMEVNLTGTLYTTYLALANFRHQTPGEDGWRGKLVATASSASWYSLPNDTLYGSSKAGILGLVRSLGPKVFKEKITVNCIGPGVVETALAPPGFNERLRGEGRLTPMTTITECVDLFIARDSKLTGQAVESCGTRNALRAIPAFMDDLARKNVNEFNPVDEIEAALDQSGYDVV